MQPFTPTEGGPEDAGQPELRLEDVVEKLILEIMGENVRARENYGQGAEKIFAISGAAALGKSRLSQKLVDGLNARGVAAALVKLDGYLIERAKREHSGYHPRSSDLERMERDLDRLLRKGEPLFMPTYEHGDGTKGEDAYVEPRRVVVLDGIMSLHHRILSHSSYRVFMDASDLHLRSMRLHEDVTNRGYTVFDALRTADRELRNFDRWIYSQIDLSDMRLHVVPEPYKMRPEDLKEGRVWPKNLDRKYLVGRTGL